MDNNKRSIFLFTILIGVFLFGIYNALSVLTIDSVTVRVNGSLNGNLSVINASTVTINFTITTATTGLIENVTNVTFMLPPSINLTYPIDNRSNSSSVGWFFTNITDRIVQFTNDSIGGENLSSAFFSFNVTAQLDNETDNSFTVIVNNGTSGNVGGIQVSTTVVMGTDTLAPRILHVNITDGNDTLVASRFELNGNVTNGTGDTPIGILGDTVNHTSMELRASNLTVNVLIAELHARTVELRFNSSGGHPNATTNAGLTAATIVAMSRTELNRTVALYSATLAASSFGGTPSNASIPVHGTFINFHIFANDSLANTNRSDNEFNRGVAGIGGYNFTVKTREGGLPTFTNVNVTDGTNTLTYTHLTQGNEWLNQNNHTLTAVFSGVNLSNKALVYFNVTSGLLKIAPGGNVTSRGGDLNSGHMNRSMNASASNAYNGMRNVTFNATLPAFNSDGQRVHFVVRMNDTQGYFTLANFSYRVDGGAPSASLDTPADLDIGVSDTIKYICTSSDGGSGIKEYVFTLTKPQSTTVVKTQTTNEVEFTGTDTNELGNYQVKCAVSDKVGNVGSITTTSSNDFVVLAGAGGGGGGGGGGGSSGSGSTTVEAEADEVVEAGQVTTSGTNFVVAVQGTVNFNVGTSSHTAKVIEIVGDEVTLEIASHEPTIVKLIVGESQELDLDHDGTDEVTVTLNRITDGKADLTFISIVTPEEAAEIEEEAREVVPVQEEEVEEEGTSTGTIVAIVIVILVILGIAYFVFWRKK